MYGVYINYGLQWEGCRALQPAIVFQVWVAGIGSARKDGGGGLGRLGMTDFSVYMQKIFKITPVIRTSVSNIYQQAKKSMPKCVSATREGDGFTLKQA